MKTRDEVIDAFLEVDNRTRGIKEWDNIYSEICEVFDSVGIKIFSPGGSTNRRCIRLYSIINDVEFMNSKMTMKEYYKVELGLSYQEYEEEYSGFYSIINNPSLLSSFDPLFKEVNLILNKQ